MGPMDPYERKVRGGCAPPLDALRFLLQRASLPPNWSCRPHAGSTCGSCTDRVCLSEPPRRLRGISATANQEKWCRVREDGERPVVHQHHPGSSARGMNPGKGTAMMSKHI